MFKYLDSEIKRFEGNIIAVGIDRKLSETLKKNKKINVYEINKADGIALFQKKKRTTNQGKTINIKKLKKYFKNKSIDYIICSYEEISKYYKYFFKDSIYLNKKKIYFYVTDDIDIDYINKYKRYNGEINIKEFKTGKVIIVDNKNSKTNFFKNIIYFIVDTITNFLDFISNILVG